MSELKRFTVEMTRAEVDKLDRKARGRNISRSQLVRSILRGAPTVLDFPRDLGSYEGKR